MTGNKTKEFSFCKIVTIEDLEVLNNFIYSEYKSVSYSIHTKNNTSYYSESFEELIKYENYTKSKIQWIRINASREAEKSYPIYSDLHIFIGEYKVEYEIRKSSEKDILCISDKLDKLILNFKSPHNWVSSFWSGWPINGTIILPLLLISGNIYSQLESILVTPWNYIIFLIFIGILGELLTLLRFYLYPRHFS